MKTIAIRGPIYEPNSHAITCRSMILALAKAGHKVRSINCPSGVWNNFPLKLKKEDHDILRAAEQEELKPNEYFLVQHVVPNQFIYDPRAALNIGYVSFETDSIPQSWLLPMQAMDAIWAPSMFNVKTFMAAGVKKNVYYVPHGLDKSIFCPDGNTLNLDIPTNVIKFGCCFDWTPRKNGINIIGSFLSAMANKDDAALILKIYFKDKSQLERLKLAIGELRKQIGCGENPKVYIISDIVNDYEMGNFYRSIDCLISASNGEGFCKPALEAMACGVVPIVSGWGGQTDFCNSTNSLTIMDCPLGPVSNDQIQFCGAHYANQNWCYPNNQNIKENISWFYENIQTEHLENLRENAIKTANLFDMKEIIKHIEDMYV